MRALLAALVGAFAASCARAESAAAPLRDAPPAAVHAASPAAAVAVAPAPAVPAATVDADLVRELSAIVARWRARADETTAGKTAASRVAVHARALTADGSRTIAALDAERALRPASNMKLVTSAAALAELGADGVFRTRFLADGPLRDGVLAGDLVVLGGGDPWYLEEAHGAVNGWTDPLLARLKELGLRRIAGRIVLDESDFQEPAPAPGWPGPEQHWTEYCALAGAFSANAGCITARVVPGVVGAPARVELAPAGHGLATRIEVRTAAARSALNVAVGVQGGTIVVRGSIPADVPEWEARFSAGDPVRLFGSVLRSALIAGGIAVDGAEVVRERGRARTAGGGELALLETPIAWSLRAINTDSNNAVADQLFLALGHQAGGAGTRAAASRVVERALTALGVSAAAYAQADGSGLSRDNRVSAAELTALLAAVRARRAPPAGDGAAAADPWTLLVESLAVGGESGKLAGRFTAPELKRRVRAKTGWIAGTSALSGIVRDAAGGEIAFSILVEYPDLPSLNNAVWKPLQDEIVARLARWTP